jgi:hypothetical protein
VTHVRLYVEGGGDDRAELRARCREGFSKLLLRSGFGGNMPRIVASGGRDRVFDDFKTAVQTHGIDELPIMLVDSEDPVTQTPWAHLRTRDRWECPAGVTDDQAQLMVTCMETWIMADRAALRRACATPLQRSALLPDQDMERRPRHDVQNALEKATHAWYCKGGRSFKILADLDPSLLRAKLPHFRRLVETLERLLLDQRP